MNSDYPFITIVMPVFNEEKFIGGTIQQLVAQQYPADKMEILVVDGMSTDGTRELIDQLSKEHDIITLLDNPKRKSGAGRNVGFRGGRGDYFVVLDGHCSIPDTHLIENIVHCFEHSGADCLGRPQPLTPPGISKFQQAVALARGSRIGHGGDSFIFSDWSGFISPVSNGAVYRREVFEKVGYVDESFDACEDVEFNYRVEQAGLTCYTDPSLTVYYYPRDSWQGLYRQLLGYGRGRRRFLAKHPSSCTCTQLVPVGFVLGVWALLLLGVLPLFQVDFPSWAVYLVALYILYVGLIGSWSVFLAAPKKCFSSVFRLPLLFFVIHYALGWGFLKESLVALTGVRCD